MKITVLVENNTKVKYYFRGEYAFSLLIEEGDKKILFDAGYTDAYLRNALQWDWIYII
jgi:7,8-dihydropterin-6-yl-methyl-4-(beta-D-ribofuranosyl)aminobenzene 5'-phosphate synthase